jgi:hypothetical protein
MVTWAWLSPIGDLAPGDPAATTRAWFDELRLAGPLAQGLRHAGLDEAEAWTAADLVRTLLHLARPSQIKGPQRERDRRLIERWLADETIRPAIGVNTWQGAEYIDRDRFARMLEWAVRLDRASGRPVRDPTIVERLGSTARETGYRVPQLLQRLAEAPRRAPRAGTRSRTATPIDPAGRRRPRRGRPGTG